MDQNTFYSSVIESLAWPVLTLMALWILYKPLDKLITSIKFMRYKDIEIELVDPTDVGKQEISIIASHLQRGPHSFQWFRDNTEFKYKDEEFVKLVSKNPQLFETITIVSRDKNKREGKPGLPGMRIKREVRDKIENIFQNS